MSLDFDVSKIKDHDNVTTGYRAMNGNFYEDADEHQDEKGKSYWVVEGDEEISVTRIWHPITEAIVWRCMGIGMGKITEENIPEFYARSMWYDLITESTPLRMNGEELHLSVEMLKSHIGLTTNVGTETRAKFFKRMEVHDFEAMLSRAKRELSGE